jgi:hypothetical protein
MLSDDKPLVNWHVLSSLKLYILLSIFSGVANVMLGLAFGEKLITWLLDQAACKTSVSGTDSN